MGQESEVVRIAQAAKEASRLLGVTTTQQRNEALYAMAKALREHLAAILFANAKDVSAARSNDAPEPLVDRLMLNKTRIADMAAALEDLAEQEDPIGQVMSERVLESGVYMQQLKVPMGVVAMIYEARPNVTADAAALCIKTANACILRGGSMALHSNLAIAQALAEAAEGAGMPKNSIQVIADPSHEATDELMQLRGLVDVLIPRGGAGLIRYCVENAKVPVIETGTGNCHIYLHRTADIEKAVPIVINAKTQRPGVCNAAESLLVDECVADKFLPPVMKALADAGVELHCDDHALAIAQKLGLRHCIAATDEDWGTEYLDLVISIKCVEDVDEAIAHINTYGTNHSEAIIAEDEAACEKFLEMVDASTVYANASTRFTDGGQFGLGAEIGISTQKLHARGPMGLDALTSMKFICRGEGQVRL